MEVVIEKRRYVGIDLGKREYTMAIISVKGKITLHEGKTSVSMDGRGCTDCWRRRTR